MKELSVEELIEYFADLSNSEINKLYHNYSFFKPLDAITAIRECEDLIDKAHVFYPAGNCLSLGDIIPIDEQIKLRQDRIIGFSNNTYEVEWWEERICRCVAKVSCCTESEAYENIQRGLRIIPESYSFYTKETIDKDHIETRLIK